MAPKIKYPVGIVGKDEADARRNRIKMFGYSPGQGKTYLIYPKGLARVEGVRFKTLVVPKDLDVHKDLELAHKLSEVVAVDKAKIITK